MTLVREELDCLDGDLVSLDIERDSGLPARSQKIRACAKSPARASMVDRVRRQHELSRVMSPHRAPDIVATAVRHGGLAVAGRARPWAVNLRTGGGDSFDVIPLQDGWWGCLVGNVTGRGVEATAEMADLRSAVRAYAVQEGCFPGRVLDHLRPASMRSITTVASRSSSAKAA